MTILLQLDDRKSSGTSDIIVPPLVSIFNLSFKTGVFPNLMKLAKVIPIFKDGSKLLVTMDPFLFYQSSAKSLKVLCTSNYMYSNSSEGFLKELYSKIYINCLVSNKLITKKQSGFRPGDSVTNQLLRLKE